jgi:hypothetical protein
MIMNARNTTFAVLASAALLSACGLQGQTSAPPFKVISFYTARSDQAHISFCREANAWFPKIAARKGFIYESTTNWSLMTPAVLSNFQVVVFLDTRPEDAAQRAAFQQYIEQGGAWLGFHFAAFALTPSAYSQNWDWYHDEFLGSGEYVSNTWRPTSAVLRVAATNHASVRHLPATFTASPNEWYRWKNDLRANSNILILLAIDPASFPLGTGPKPHEIWREGYYPVVWTNKKYRMLYVNMGHNDIDYEQKTNRELSFSFTNAIQNQLILDGLAWLGTAKEHP